jgi:hypothetical protein
MKKYSILSTLISKKLRLMADDDRASLKEPQVMVIPHMGHNYISISFICFVISSIDCIAIWN